MRHFRDAAEIEAFLVDEHLRQGLPVLRIDGMSLVPLAVDEGLAEPARPAINLTRIAAAIWEKLS